MEDTTLEERLDHLSPDQLDFILELVKKNRNLKAEHIAETFSFNAYPLHTTRENYVPALYLRIYMGTQLRLTQCFLSTLDSKDGSRLSEEAAAKRSAGKILTIIPEELIPGIVERVAVKQIEKMERTGATNLQLSLMVKVQEKKGARKMDGRIAKMYEDGTVTVVTVDGKSVSVDQSLVSVPKGAVAALKAGR